MKFRLLLFILLATFFSCKESYTPKPTGYFRIDFPQKEYHTLSDDFPYQFDIAGYTQIEKDLRNPDEPYWINLLVSQNNAELHLSYYALDGQQENNNQLVAFIEESRDLAYKHSIKASSIGERVFMNPGDEVYGTIYDIAGNAASPMQFYLTDSTDHFLRGALYIRATPNIDSLRPVIEFLETDIVRLIETTKWN